MPVNPKILQDFTDEEKALVDDSDTRGLADTNKLHTAVEIYVARMNRESAQLTIEANKEISASSERWTKSLTNATWWLMWATVGLVITGIAQVIVGIVSIVR